MAQDGPARNKHYYSIVLFDLAFVPQSPRYYSYTYIPCACLVSRSLAGSHKQLERAFAAGSENGDIIRWSPRILDRYGVRNAAHLTPVLLRPGQAVLMQYQTVHGIGPNNTDTDRIQIYFRLTAGGRPTGCKIHYPAAMQDVTLELPGLRATLAQKKRQWGT